MSIAQNLIMPNWPAPDHVRAYITTRNGGVSHAPYNDLNLAEHVGDEPGNVASNRSLLNALLPAEPHWLNQVHGNNVLIVEDAIADTEADASVAAKPGIVCAVLTADCLPLLICDRRGSKIAAVHAGWRGLSNGVIENAIAAMRVPPPELLVYLGPAIGPRRYEVGDDVRDVFIDDEEEALTAFMPTEDGKWLANLYELAQLRLRRVGVEEIYGGEYCTFNESERFFSYRRDGVTGRMASLIWLETNGR